MRTFLSLACLLAFPATVRAELDRHDGSPKVKVIDMHTHVFNARDLPLGGILGRFDVPWPLNDILKEILLAAAATDDSNRDFSITQVGEAVTTPQITLTDAQRRELLRLTGDRRAAVRSLADQVTPDTALVIDALLKAGFPPTENAPPPKPDVEMTLTRANIDGVLKFLGIMLTNHRDVARYLSKTAFPQVDLFVHHMMDMENAYDDTPRNLFEDQITQVQTVDAEFGNFIHFVAYDPFRKGDALPLVQKGYAAGAIGVKIYPPSGYRATANFFPPAPSGGGALRRWERRYRGWKNPAELDANLDAFFTWASDHGIPILTHCTPNGFEAVSGYGMRADPYFWGQVLVKHPKLRLCFGHGGGEYYWFSDPAKDSSSNNTDPSMRPVDRENPDASYQPNLWLFGKQVTELCLGYENVYCEVGYLKGILAPTQRALLTARLQADLHQQSPKGPWKLGDHIMYGTDWHMMIKEPHYEQYTEDCDDVIRAVDNGTWRKAFFAGNAVGFLRLNNPDVQKRLSQNQRDVVLSIIAGTTAP